MTKSKDDMGYPKLSGCWKTTTRLQMRLNSSGLGEGKSCNFVKVISGRNWLWIL
jgi:hypothetical protein